MISITFNASGAAITLRVLGNNAANLAPAMDEIGVEIAERVRQGFGQNQSPYGRKWQALSAVTQAVRGGRRAGGQPLRDTGRLASSVSHASSARSVTIGTNVEYAGTHQYGAKQGQYGTRSATHKGPIPWGNIPARQFLPTDGLPKEWQQSVIEILQSHMRQGVPA